MYFICAFIVTRASANVNSFGILALNGSIIFGLGRAEREEYTARQL
jgi:hypothetical protein